MIYKNILKLTTTNTNMYKPIINHTKTYKTFNNNEHNTKISENK